jgi:hypothetical protein
MSLVEKCQLKACAASFGTAQAFALLDTGQFAAVLVGSGVEFASRPPVKQHAAPHGTMVLEARRVPMQTFQEHVRDVIVPKLRGLG